MRRRDFLVRTGLVLGALSVPERLISDPYAPLPRAASRMVPVRVRGRVTGNGRAIAGARVSDGIAVARTDREGRYTLIADGRQPFVFVSTPAGWQPATNTAGTAHFYASMPREVAEATINFSLRPRPNDAAHALLVLADPQTQDRSEIALLHAETVPDIVATVAGLADRATIGVACGDIMFDDLSLYPEYERAVGRTGLPFYQVVGNHDLDGSARTTEDSSKTFRGYFGPAAYSFDLGAIRYVVLNSVFWYGAGYVGYVGADQIAWLSADLADLEPGRTVVVLQHIPAMSTADQRRTGAEQPGNTIAQMNRELIYRLLEPYRSTIISGHMHEFERFRDGGADHLVAGAVCGAWWSGPICYDGTPNGYLVLHGDDERVSWRYKSTGRADDHQMRIYARGADPTAPDEICANIWAADDGWTVTWSEDESPRGLMARRIGRDPLSVELHQGSTKPAKRTWVEPMPTRHLYYATPAPTARLVTVTARDAQGRSFREDIRLQ